MSKESKRQILLYTILIITVINFILLIYLINPFDIRSTTVDWEGKKQALRLILSVFVAIFPYFFIISFYGALGLRKMGTIIYLIFSPTLFYVLDCIGVFFVSQEIIGIISIIEKHQIFSISELENYTELMGYIFLFDFIYIVIGFFILVFMILVWSTKKKDEAPASVNGGDDSE